MKIYKRSKDISKKHHWKIHCIRWKTNLTLILSATNERGKSVVHSIERFKRITTGNMRRER